MLVETMLAGRFDCVELASKLVACRVEDMQDGGMGSIRFLPPSVAGSRSLTALAEAEYVDADGVLVSIVINGDKRGELYELDFWKVEVSPLKRYPTPPDLRVK
jgi:hypothetical protein